MLWGDGDGLLLQPSPLGSLPSAHPRLPARLPRYRQLPAPSRPRARRGEALGNVTALSHVGLTWSQVPQRLCCSSGREEPGLDPSQGLDPPRGGSVGLGWGGQDWRGWGWGSPALPPGSHLPPCLQRDGAEREAANPRGTGHGRGAPGRSGGAAPCRWGGDTARCRGRGPQKRCFSHGRWKPNRPARALARARAARLRGPVLAGSGVCAGTAAPCQRRGSPCPVRVGRAFAPPQFPGCFLREQPAPTRERCRPGWGIPRRR